MFKVMFKRLLLVLTIVCGVCLSPILGLLAYDWYSNYQEARNDFTLAQACQLKAGQNIDEALKVLGNPTEYHTYNFSNVYSGQYRNLKRGYFVEIAYAQDEGTIDEIFWGQGRTKTLTQSGACPQSG